MGELAGRVAVAAVLAPLVLAACWAGGVWMLLVGLVATALALHEYFRMARVHRPIPLTGHAAGLGVVAVTYYSGLDWSLAVLLGLGLATFLVVIGTSPRESALVTIAVTTFGVVWIAYGMAFLVLVRKLDDPADLGLNLLLAVLVGTWTSDIFAYFGGRLVGRRRLAPAISPNKTVEGFVIGLAGGTFAAWVTLYDHPFQPVESLWVALAIALAAPIGDLFESFVKRDLGVKDSGTLLAGHGGVLDRIDALLFAGVAAYFVARAIGTP
jgi:phosphatidate cytidylyltransferase